MEQKLVRVPFEADMAKKITEESVEGRIVTRDGRSVRIICWDAKRDDSIIALVTNHLGVEFPTSYNYRGKYFIGEEHKNDLFLEIPEYLTFKDGDILYCRGIYEWTFIYRSGAYDKTSCYAAKSKSISKVCYESCLMSDEEVKELRVADEDERNILIEALKVSKEPKAKEYLKRFFGIELESQYSQYKDGDILRAYDNIVIVKNPHIDEEGNFNFKQHAGYNCKSGGLVDVNNYMCQECVRYANPEEKEIIKKAMQESGNPKYDDVLKNIFRIEEKPKCEFKPFDKVLVRDKNNECWYATFFSHKNSRGYNCVGCTWNHCIPYNEKTAHLLGTTEAYNG